jgi:hypothetical protein
LLLFFSHLFICAYNVWVISPPYLQELYFIVVKKVSLHEKKLLGSPLTNPPL